MDSLPEGSIVVLPGNRLQYSSGSIFYKFRQNTDFFYLTGWDEQDSAIILGGCGMALRLFVQAVHI